jgi:hypothetical protein
MAESDFGHTKYPRRGLTSTVLSLVIVGFLLLMVLLYLWLRREPDQQRQTQPDRPQSSEIIIRVAEKVAA